MQYWETRPLLPPTPMPYRVHTRGRVRNAPQHATMGTYNQDCMLILVVSGEGRYFQHGAQTSVLPGMVGIILPQEDVGVLTADRENPYDHYFCRFAGNLALETAGRLSRAQGGHSFWPCVEWRGLLDIFIRLYATPQPEDHLFTEQVRPCDALLAQLLAFLDFPKLEHGPAISTASVEHFLSEHLTTPLDIGIMAEYFGVTREYLCRRVRSVTGQTPLELWRDLKIEWARNMLQNSTMRVQEISWRLGFRDQYYFSKVFRKCTGQSPSQARQSTTRPARLTSR